MPPRFTGMTSAIRRKKPKHRMLAILARHHPANDPPHGNLDEKWVHARSMIADDYAISLGPQRERIFDLRPPQNANEELREEPEERLPSGVTGRPNNQREPHQPHHQEQSGDDQDDQQRVGHNGEPPRIPDQVTDASPNEGVGRQTARSGRADWIPSDFFL